MKNLKARRAAAVDLPHSGAPSVEQFVELHGTALLGVARRFSNSSADADDAYQRALEVLLTKPPGDRSEIQLLAWMRTVVRNEALQIHRRRLSSLGEPIELLEGVAHAADDPADRVEVRERYSRHRQVIRRLKPDHARCLLLRADGMDYAEIGQVTGLTYTKVARYLADGRSAMRATLRSIERGHECQRVSPLLSRIADGMAGDDELRDAEIHLSDCRSCRATLRAYRDTPRIAASTFPLGQLLPEKSGTFGSIGDALGSAFTTLQEKLAGHATSMQQGAEVLTVKKVVAVTAAVATLTAGGATVKSVTTDDPSRDTRRPPAGSDGAPLGATAPIGNQPDTATARSRNDAERPRRATAADASDPDFGRRPASNADEAAEADPIVAPPVAREPAEDPVFADPVETKAPAAAPSGDDLFSDPLDAP